MHSMHMHSPWVLLGLHGNSTPSKEPILFRMWMSRRQRGTYRKGSRTPVKYGGSGNNTKE